MELLIVIFAAIAAWVAGSLYYMVLSGPWLRLPGVKVDNRGRPSQSSAWPYLVSGLAMLLVAAMIRSLLDRAGVHSLGGGLALGAQVGAFIVTPWILINHTRSQRAGGLVLIEGGYAVLACAIMGAVIGAI